MAGLENATDRIADAVTIRTLARHWQVLLAIATVCAAAFTAGLVYAAIRWEIRDLRATMNRRFTELEHRVEPLLAAHARQRSREIASKARDCTLKRLPEAECLQLFSRGELEP